MTAQVRASWTRQVVSAFAAAEQRSAVVAQIPQATQERIANASWLGWIPLAEHMAVCDAIRTELGDAGYRAHFCDATMQAGQVTIFEPLIRGYLALFGRTPAGPLRAAPRAWSFIFREMGRLHVGQITHGEVACAVRDLDHSLRGGDTFALGVQGALDACLGFVEYTGSVAMDTRQLSAGIVRFDLSWPEQS